jgi:4'-phosphopantetheinyl transferase
MDRWRAWDWRLARTALERGRVQIVRVDLSSAASLNHEVLGADERRRGGLFRHERDRRRFEAAHCGLRNILAAFTGVPSRDLVFESGRSGKPRLVGGVLEFNLTHSGDIALVAVSCDGAVGIDVEQQSASFDWRPLADRFFSAAEQSELRQTAPRAQQRYFYECWTRKEAYLKATGEGFQRDPTSVTIASRSMARGRIRVDGPPASIIRDLDVGGNCAGAIAHPPDRECDSWQLADQV